MQLINVSTRHLPTVSDGIISCFVNEPFKLLANSSYTADVGWSISDNIPRTRLFGWRNDNILIYNVKLPFISIVNFGEDKQFGKGDLLAYLGVSLLFTVRLEGI
jgi:hypothetical protein